MNNDSSNYNNNGTNNHTNINNSNENNNNNINTNSTDNLTHDNHIDESNYQIKGDTSKGKKHRKDKVEISPEQAKYLRTVKNKERIIILTRILILVGIFVLWEVAGRLKWIDPFLTSTPSRMWKSFLTIYREGTLFRHIWVTCYETILGFSLGTIFGTLIAILLYLSDFASKVLDPYLVVLNALPKVALAPIIIFWVGNGMKAIVVVALLISIVVTILGMLNGFREVDEDKIKLLKTFGASKLQILSHLIIPATVPTLISSLKINVGLSWVGVIMGEFLVAKEGLGFLIVFGGQISQLDMVMMSIIVLVILAYIMYEAVSLLEKKFNKSRI